MIPARTERSLTFALAKALYVHRYTMEHVPRWATFPLAGKYYAPQFSSDREWYNNTRFPGEAGNPHVPGTGDCYTTNQSWPLGQWLEEPLELRTAT